MKGKNTMPLLSISTGRLQKQLEATLRLRPNEAYAEKPITFFRRFVPSFRWPKVIKDIFTDIFLDRTTRAIIKAPRGGGKSQVLSAIGFAKWYFQDRSFVDMGGSQRQAKTVYNYFADYCTSDKAIVASMPGEPQMNHTENAAGKFFECISASPKQIRGPHPDGLLADEVCETKDELILAALPMVDTSEHPLLVMSSTFHKIFGIFQETWDKAAELGYKRYQWDIFDVCKPFSPKLWNEPEIRKIPDIDRLIALAKGKTGDPEGWVPILNIIQAWREKPSLDHFLVELMGNRPSAAGLVLNPEDVEAAVFDDSMDKQYDYVNGAECTIGIDWGFSSMTAVTEWMRHKDDIKVMLHNQNYQQIEADEINQDVVKRCKDHGIRIIRADSEAKFENKALQSALNKARVPTAVIEMVFSKEKPFMVGNLKAHFERQKVKIPYRFREAYYQFKRLRWMKGTNKIKKEFDHVPDSSMCALKQWPIAVEPAQLASASESNDDDRPIFHDALDIQF
jgi:hypothetical protein